MNNDGGDGWRWSAFDRVLDEMAACTCYHTCACDPLTACSLSGKWHVHPGEPCPTHPEAPGDR